ncbi:MAG: pyridoxamine 5'-phosphate oxidase family protein [Gammaproteobacteria bacterium]|jgi:hypothetical protein
MVRLDAQMQILIRNFSLGSVATVNDDGSPAVSPKATFVVVDDQRIAYGDIRSPGTRQNLLARPAVEVVFCDILARLAVRVRGTAAVVDKDSAVGSELRPHFDEYWAPYVDMMREFVLIEVEHASLIKSPGYDIGLSREELVAANFEKLSRLARA